MDFYQVFSSINIYWIAKCKKEKSSKHCEFESKIGQVRKAQTKEKGFAESSFKFLKKHKSESIFVANHSDC